MSEDEVMVLIVSAAALFFWVRWMHLALSASRFNKARPIGVMLGGPLAAGAIILATLLTLAADDVRNDGAYIVLYTLFGAAWVRLSLFALPLMGVSPYADVLERRNGAAGIAVAGATIALALCYAGSNIGNGPGWWVVLFTAALATVSLFALWSLLQMLTGISELITIDRDQAAAIRLAALLVGAGLVMGRGAGGDWDGYEDAVLDFVDVSWPTIVLVLVEVGVTAVLRPRPETPQPGVVVAGLAPGGVYLACAVGYTISLGWPS